MPKPKYVRKPKVITCTVFAARAYRGGKVYYQVNETLDEAVSDLRLMRNNGWTVGEMVQMGVPQPPPCKTRKRTRVDRKP